MDQKFYFSECYQLSIGPYIYLLVSLVIVGYAVAELGASSTAQAGLVSGC